MRKTLLFLLSFFCIYVQSQICAVPRITDALWNEEVLVDCSYPMQNNGKCLSLSVDYPKFFSTDQYQVTSQSFLPVVPLNSGTALNANYDDLFAEKLSLPFDFCFYGVSYNELVVGCNGLITFDLSQLGNVSYPNITANNPSPQLPKNSIFGVLSDMVFSAADDSEIYYSVIGSAPCRKFVVNFYRGRMAGCEERISSQIVLHEGSNEIDVFVESKPLPCGSAKFRESLIGIQNKDGTIGATPPGRQTGVWSAQNEGWKFSPAGGEIMPIFSWKNSSGETVGSAATVSVCPEKNEVYSVEISYSACGKTYKTTDAIAVNFAPDFPLANDFTVLLCSGNASGENVDLNSYQTSLTPNPSANFNFTFHLSQSDAESRLNPQPTNVVITSSATYFVRVESKSNTSCFRVSLLQLDFISNAVSSNVTVCDLNGDGIETNFVLSRLRNQLISSGASGTLEFYATAADANNSVNHITTMNLTATSVFWVRFNSGGCSLVHGPVSVNFSAGPVINTPVTFSDTLCDIHANGLEPYSFSNIDSLITSDTSLQIKYYSTYDQAVSGTGDSMFMVTEGTSIIYARVEIPGGCYSIAEVHLIITFTKVEAINKNAVICFDGTEDKTFDLSVLAQGMLQSEDPGITVTYFDNYFNAVEGSAVYQIPLSQTITDNGPKVFKEFFVRFENSSGCYTVRSLTVTLLHPQAAQTSFQVCDKNNDGQESVNLSVFRASILGVQSGSVTFFSVADGTGIINTPVTVNGNLQVWAQVNVEGCTEIYPIQISLVPVPNVTSEITKINNNQCDNNNDGTELFDLTALQQEIYSGAQPVIFSWYSGYDATSDTFQGFISNPTVYEAGSTSTVFAKVTSVSGHCHSVSKITIVNHFLPAIKLRNNAVLKKCDYDFNLQESFTLSDAIDQIFIQSENTVPLSDIAITYYATKEHADAGLPGNQIAVTQITTISEVTVWARFTDSNGCFSTAPILLKTYLPPKAISSTITICDTDLDGIPQVNLMNFTNQMVDLPHAENSFTFYLTQTDAQNAQNAIQNPENLEQNPMPTRVWVRVENIPGCFDVNFIDLKIGDLIPVLASSFTIDNVCDVGNDLQETIDITQFENQIFPTGAFSYFPSETDLHNGTNEIQNPQNYLFNGGLHGTTIYIKVTAADYCPALATVFVSLKKEPAFQIEDQYFCPYNDGFVDIKPNFSGLDIVQYEWKNPSGEIISTSDELLGVNQAGIYTVNVVGANGCTFSTQFEVKAFDVPVITELIANGDSYTVIAEGTKPIVYSVDGVTWQNSNIFSNLPHGVITFYVKYDGEDCLGLEKQGLITKINNVITPNGDGINDFWEIDGLHVFDGKNSTVKIFDRYEKTVFRQETNQKISWDGKSLGRPVPTGTYWYTLQLGDGRFYSGWILVKNRD